MERPLQKLVEWGPGLWPWTIAGKQLGEAEGKMRGLCCSALLLSVCVKHGPEARPCRCLVGLCTHGCWRSTHTACSMCMGVKRQGCACDPPPPLCKHMCVSTWAPDLKRIPQLPNTRCHCLKFHPKTGWGEHIGLFSPDTFHGVQAASCSSTPKTRVPKPG